MAENTPLECAARFAALARQLQSRPTREHTARQIVDLAATTVAGADHAGLTAPRRDGTLDSLAHTDELVLRLDHAQRRLAEGPCRETGSGEQVLHVPDTAGERRWPRFARCAEELGVRSLLCCRLEGERGPLGTLALYAAKPDAFDARAVRTAAVFGEHAALALSRATLIGSLQAALASRQQIGEATGLLMERYRVSSSQAFGMLVHSSQHLNTKLREVAARIVETGLPPDDALARTLHEQSE